MNFCLIFTLCILYLTEVNGFFFGGGSSCNCPPPPPPSVCPNSCEGYPAAAPVPPPPLQTYSQGTNYHLPQQSQPQPQPQHYQQHQAQGSYAVPEVHAGNHIGTPPPPSAFIQPPPVESIHDLGASKGTYVNPHVPSNNKIRYESLEPPTPPPLSSKHIVVRYTYFIKFNLLFSAKG